MLDCPLICVHLVSCLGARSHDAASSLASQLLLKDYILRS